MSIAYNGLYVDEKYSAILEPNLYYANPFVDGVTFTSKYEIGPGGAIYVSKLATNPVTPGTPGRDFSDEATTNTLIPILLNNNYQKSKKIYGVQASAVDYNLANETLGVAVQEVGEGMGQSGLACLVAEGTASAQTASITTANLKSSIIKDRKAVVKAKGRADVILMSPDTFATMLEASGAEFTPESNEFVNANGQIGKWLGFTIMEVPGLSATTATYYNSVGSLTTSTFSAVDYILYNHEALSIIPNFDTARIVDSENFVGSKAQVEANLGFKVTNADLVVVRRHS